MRKSRPVRTTGGIVRWPPPQVPPPPPPPQVPPAKQGSTPPVTCKREHNRWKRRPDGRRYCMSCQALSMWRHRGGPPPQLTFTKDGHSLRELVKEWEREKEGGEMRRPECARCGVWVCTECGWRRNAADRAHPEPVCHLCASAEGYWLSIRHRYPWKHADPPSDPLPDPEGSTR